MASALIPTKAGDRRKHDQKDAANLARLYRAGELTPIRIPTEAEERVREIVRCRETLQREILRSRHYLLKLLLRRGLIYHAGAHWTLRHRTWLEEQRRAELDRQIEALALTPLYQPVVARLTCFRGINTLGAMVLATELGDWQRFAKPTHLMAYLGLVPTGHSSGSYERRGAITKAVNSRCRHILVQAAWGPRRPPRQSALLTRRQRGQPPALVAHAWKAQHRLHRLFHRIAAVAVARELVAFLWAVMHPADTVALHPVAA